VRQLLRRSERHGYPHNAGYQLLWFGAKARLVHRLVMETLLGRRLRTDEHVHHVDGDKHNNRPDNLQLLSANEHAWRTNHRYPLVAACAWCQKLFRPYWSHGRVTPCCSRSCAGFLCWRRKRPGPVRKGGAGRKIGEAVPGGGGRQTRSAPPVAGTVLSSQPQRRD